jgi:RimJ/RimL family protein N-acetyltransferase
VIVSEINGPGVRLRALRDGDVDALVAGYSDETAQRFMPHVPAPFTRDFAERFVHRRAPEMFAEGGAFYAIADPVTDRLLGAIGMDRPTPTRQQAELGYWVGPWARRSGVATAALTAMTEHAFSTGVLRVELLTYWENAASQRVALAAGYQREGVRRGAVTGRDGERDDLLAYARLATDPAGPTPRLLPDLPGGELSDGVVTLRPLNPGDVDFYLELNSVQDVVDTSVPPVRPSLDEARRRCTHAEAHWLAGTRADLVIVDAATGTPTGSMGLFYQEPPTGQAMLGYGQLPAWRGRGYTTRAAQLLSLWVFAETDIARLIAGTLPTNKGSQRVLEKAGFVQEGYLRSRLPGPDNQRIDDIQYVLLPEDLIELAKSSGTGEPGADGN